MIGAAGEDCLETYFPPIELCTPGNIIRENEILNQKPIIIKKGYGSSVTGNTTPAYSGSKITIENSDYSVVTNNYQGTTLMTVSAGDISDAGGSVGLVAD